VTGISNAPLADYTSDAPELGVLDFGETRRASCD
jgi:hypothetical protein